MAHHSSVGKELLVIYLSHFYVHMSYMLREYDFGRTLAEESGLLTWGGLRSGALTDNP